MGWMWRRNRREGSYRFVRSFTREGSDEANHPRTSQGTHSSSRVRSLRSCADSLLTLTYRNTLGFFEISLHPNLGSMRQTQLKPITSSSLKKISSTLHKNEVPSIPFLRFETDLVFVELSTLLSLASLHSHASNRRERQHRQTRMNENKNGGRGARAIVRLDTASKTQRRLVPQVSVVNRVMQLEEGRRTRSNSLERISVA